MSRSDNPFADLIPAHQARENPFADLIPSAETVRARGNLTASPPPSLLRELAGSAQAGWIRGQHYLKESLDALIPDVSSAAAQARRAALRNPLWPSIGEAVNQGMAQSMGIQPMPGDWQQRQAEAEYRQNFDRALSTADAERRAMQAERMSPQTEQQMHNIAAANKTDSLLDAAMLVAKSPRAVGNIIAQSIGTQAPGLLATLAGGGAGRLVTAGIAGASSGNTEYQASLHEAMQEAGINLTQPHEVARFLSDAQAMQQAQDTARKRAGAVGLFDAATAGAAGLALRGAKPSAASIGSRVAAEGGIQAAGGMAGETAAQALTQDHFNLGDILVEGLAEVPTGAVEVPANLRAARRQAKSGMQADPLTDPMENFLRDSLRVIEQQRKRVQNTDVETRPPEHAQKPPSLSETEPAADIDAMLLKNLGEPPNAAPVLQNRDRSTQASIDQMQAIAQQPDYLRTGISRSMDQGAPVVFGTNDTLPASALTGRAETIVDGKGERVQSRYAVVEARDILPSHRADGTANADYTDGIHGPLRTVAGNGRAAGLIEGYRRGTAGRYRAELEADAEHLGIDPAAIAAMQQPVLVRVMNQTDIKADIGDRSNITASATLSPLEQAANDARRLDVTRLEFDEHGAPSSDAALAFVRAMPESERGTLLNPDGSLTRQGIDRIKAAAFLEAYGNEELVRLYAQATDPEARAVINALAGVAGRMAQLKGHGEFDVRDLVAQTGIMAVNAKRHGEAFAQFAQQRDLASDPDVMVVADFVARNLRSSKALLEGLRRLADIALAQVEIVRSNAQQGGIFGDRPTLTRRQILETLNDDTHNARVQDQGRSGSLEEDTGRGAAERGRRSPDGAGTRELDPGDSGRGRGSATEQERFALESPATDSGQQRTGDVTPPASGDLFAPATQADHIRAAREAKDQARNTSEGRTDMLAGEGELFAEPRPEQGSFSRRPQGDDEPVARLTGKEIGSSLSAGTVVEQAREWFKANLQGSIVKRNGLSPVRISGKGWNKVKRGLTTDLDKARLIPAIPAIIRSGNYLGRFPIDKARTDDIVAFHHFQAPVNLAGQQVMAGVSVAEDSFGNLFYNLNRDPQALLEKKKGPAFTQEKARGAEPLEGEITFSRTMGDSDAEVNLEIEYPATRDLSSIAAAVPSYAQSDSGDGAIVLTPPNADKTNANDTVSVKRVQALVDTVRKGWTNAPEIVIATDMHDERLPAAIRKADAEQRRQGASGEVDGVYWQGQVYLIASNLKTDADVARVMFHEILGHHGLRGAFGEALNPLLDALVKERSKDVETKRNEYGLPDTPEGRRLAAEEVLASMAESAPTLGWVKRAIAAIRQWLRKAGLNLELTDNDIIQQFILPAQEFVLRGEQAQSRFAEPVFSRDRQGQDWVKWAMEQVSSAPMRTATNFQQAREAAKAFQGKPLTNRQTGMTATLSRNSLDKMLSSTAVNKSESPAIHVMAVANADSLFQQAILGWSKQDRDNDPGLAAIHRFFAPMEIDGRMKMVKVTVKETARHAQANTLYTVEAVEFNEKSPAATWVESAFQSDGIDPKSILSARDVLTLAHEIERRNNGDTTDAAFPRRAEAKAWSHFTEEQQAFLTKAGLRPDTRGVWQKLHDLGRGALAWPAKIKLVDTLMQGGIDRYWGLKRAVAKAAHITPETDPHQAVRQIQTASTMEAILRFGAPEMDKSGALKVKRHQDGTPTIPGLLEGLAPVWDQLPQFFGWMVARRAQLLKQQGREQLMSDEDIAIGLAFRNGNEAAFDAAARNYLNLKDAILDLAQEHGGIIDPAARAAWDHIEYIPFYRAEGEEGRAFGPGTRKGLAHQSAGIRRLTGSDKQLNDPLSNIIQNFTRLIDSSLKNRAIEPPRVSRRL